MKFSFRNTARKAFSLWIFGWRKYEKIEWTDCYENWIGRKIAKWRNYIETNK